MQLDPIRDFPIHVDFLRLGKDALVTVRVPVRFWNEAAPAGLRRVGVLNIVRHEIQVRCASDAIPDHFEVDLTGLEIGDAVHISALKVPENVKPTITERVFTVATIVGRAADEPVAGAPTAPDAEPGDEGARLRGRRCRSGRRQAQTRRSKDQKRSRRRISLVPARLARLLRALSLRQDGLNKLFVGRAIRARNTLQPSQFAVMAVTPSPPAYVSRLRKRFAGLAAKAVGKSRALFRRNFHDRVGRAVGRGRGFYSSNRRCRGVPDELDLAPARAGEAGRGGRPYGPNT